MKSIKRLVKKFVSGNVNQLKDNKGFTLVELIVVMLVIGLVFTAVYQLFSSSNRYLKEINFENEYQNLVTEVLYELRVELADCAKVQSFETGSNDSSGNLVYDSANVDSNYGYIISDAVSVAADGTVSGGGTTIKGLAYDASGVAQRTTDRNIGVVDSTKPYRLDVTFRSRASGETDICVTVYRTDYQDASGNYALKKIYEQSTTMKLRSGLAPIGSDDKVHNLRYKLS